MQLLAVLYTNRAISQSCLKNFGSCIRDCKAAIASYPSHLKAYSKGAKAALALSKTEQALEFCEHGLSLFPNCDDLMQIQMNALRLQVELDRKAAAKAKVEKRDAEKQLATFQLALKHGVRINFKLPPIDVPDAAGVLFYADASDRLHWSVLFMYPEFGETDFLRDCVESSSVLDCLKLVFNPEQPAPSWDPQRKYTCKDESLEVYFEDTVDEQKMISFPVITTLKQLTRRKDFSLRRDLLIIIHVISKNSAKFYERWKTRLDEF
ncbi:unnamed protein product [Calicophoron daubneyi]|uniref:Cns1/TTC4 wheel domain-containing protein n=1 Tax=Calicophoron daubneyi TaxID=300641 RepID=A0AAV2T6T3_CALDB